MKPTFAVFATLTALLFTGCQSLQFDQKKRAEVSLTESNALTLSEGYFGANGKLEETKKQFTMLVLEAQNSESPTKAKLALQYASALRDSTIADMMQISNYLYDEQKDGVFTGKASQDTLFKIIDLGLTGTAASFGSTSTKSALAAAATFLTGAKLAIDENYYAKQTISTIIVTMDGRRAQVERQILAKKGLSPLEFSLQEGILLVQKFHRAGSLIDAVVELNRKSSAAADEAIQSLRDAEIQEAQRNSAASR
jgi:hypothetical protein